jgi:hypothetical protein
MPNTWNRSLARITVTDVITKHNKIVTAIGVSIPHNLGSIERGNAISAEMSRAITKPPIMATKVCMGICRSHLRPQPPEEFICPSPSTPRAKEEHSED